MGNDDLLTDDYVADLLAKEASDCSLKYSTMGMEAYTSSSPRPASKFKPNTRFLRNIIKGTNRHNDALAAKELSESQARLRDLADAEEEKRKKYNPTASEIRGRQLGNIAALLSSGKPGAGARKRRRPEEEGGEASEMQKARAAEDARRVADLEAAARRQRGKGNKRRRSLERYSVRRGREREAEDEEDTYSRRNSSSENERPTEKGQKRRRERSRSPKSSPKRHRHRSPMRGKRKSSAPEEHSDRPYRRHSEPEREPSKTEQDDDDADSDPSEDLIGPAPPRALPRGRGALKGSSGMDSRFSSDYDPKSDVQLDLNARDDWDDAVEAFRDRAKMRQQGADRLRQAGFTEEQVKKWERGGEKTIDDVKWSRKGEKREWDRGKDVDQEGDE